MKNGVQKITKKEFYSLGGFSNPKLFRKQTGAAYSHYKDNR